MSGKKMRKLRKELGMTKENLRNKEDTKVINVTKKVAHFKNNRGDISAVLANRGQVINTNLNYYRKKKKELKEQKDDK